MWRRELQIAWQASADAARREGRFHPSWQIHPWWKWWPTANVGIATGVASGLLVLDIDPRNGGDVSLRATAKRIPGRIQGVTGVRTGSGGTHLYFEWRTPTSSRANIRPGIDVKADGGYVVAPPSLHISGSRYRFVSNSGLIPPPLPAALHDLILPKARAQGGGTPRVSMSSTVCASATRSKT